MKNELKTHFEQNFTPGSYEVGIWRAWCFWKACEICSSLVQKQKIEKKKNSSHKLPKLQLTSFGFQGILGVKTAQWLKSRVPKKKFVSPIESWVFTFFTFCLCSWCHLQYDCSNLNAKSFTSSIVLEFWVKTPSIKWILINSHLQI